MYDFQKANIWKRISAALFDFILLCVIIAGVATLLSFALNYKGYETRLAEVYDKYEDEYGIDFDLPADQYEKLAPEELEKYEKASEAISNDTEAIYVYTMIVNSTFIIVTCSILIAYLLLEFIVPLIFKNGQTFGKKIFGIAVMREDGIRLSPMLLFARTLLGKYTVETMIPVLIFIMIYLNLMGAVGIIVAAAMLIAEVVLFCVTKARTPLHDKLAHTVTVDFASQMIFETPEDMIAYKQRIHAEQVEAEKN